jgi:hypothetical protein
MLRKGKGSKSKKTMSPDRTEPGDCSCGGGVEVDSTAESGMIDFQQPTSFWAL